MGRKRRRFTREFKAEAVALVRQGTKSVGEIARDLDLVESALRRWVQQAEVDDGHGRNGMLTTQDKEELARLRRENRELRTEREILKKAAAFFARESR